MEKIVKELEHIIKGLNGKLICIGISEKILIDNIRKNEQIFYCDLLNSDIFSKDKNKGKKKKDKTLSINDFRKYYKKKKINYTICNIKDMYKFYPKFIPDSVRINSSYIYIYGDVTYDYEKIEKKYKRYGAKIETIVDNKEFLLKIDLTHKKINFIKEKCLFVIDNIDRVIDIISDAIIS